MPKPFEVAWSDAAIGKVLDQVRAYDFPPAPEGGGWAYGCDADFLREICAYWTDGYDVAAAMADLNRFPQFTARVEDFDLHFVHVVGEAQGKRPLLLSHGWPGSHYEFWAAVEPLAFPSKFGGDPADAFDLVIPSLPGFGFSSKPARPIGQRSTARLFNALMTDVLGYDRYLAQGGDWGGLVTSWLGLDHGQHVKAIHLNMFGLRPPGPPQNAEEVAWLTRFGGMMDLMGAYFRLQASKPQSVAWLGANNPVGQAAWILERFHDWADLRSKPFDQVFSRDQLLTNIMLYVMTGSFTTGAWYYRGLLEEGGVVLAEGQRCETPTAFAAFPGEPIYAPPPRSWADRAYNIVRWTDPPRGGHFAAMEEPGLFVDDVRAWGRDASVRKVI
ncbi:putative hydrolase or acyltransferase of alpha/beta superfamily [Caulobacter sp. AP07]|uniref:epoxide hydrolase family protein n=1 Tax=Caulobacter sp. AP07 TaxID=1144304 RepID=UPI0002720BC7|nr:epoxide hydrolase family protein [Caulobacter sp. AP07]EJL34753.1 putative hydrolase or acyltransferase of alpha/beta superfamily [Caulobacter sp. AP07]